MGAGLATERQIGSAGVPLSLALARLTHAAERELAAVLRAEGLRVEDWRVLDHLARSGKASMSELAEATLVSGATVTRLVDKLTSLGLLYRTPGAVDRRLVHVHLSARGARRHAALAVAVQHAEAAMVHSFAVDAALREPMARVRAGLADGTA